MPLEAARPIVNEDGTMTDAFRGYMLDVDSVTGDVPWLGNIATDEGLQFGGLGLGGVFLTATESKGAFASATKSILMSGTAVGLQATTGSVQLITAGGTAINVTSAGRVSVNGGSTVSAGTSVKGIAGDSVAMRVENSGGSASLDVMNDGSVRMAQLGTGTGQTLEWNATAGELVRDTSSIAYKEDVEDYPDPLDELMRFRPRIYKRKDTGEVEAGFIAEEAHEAGLEKYVVYDADGKPISMRYAKVTALLTAALQQMVRGL